MLYILLSVLLTVSSFYPSGVPTEPCITKANTERIDRTADDARFRLVHNCEVTYVYTQVLDRWGNVVAEETGTNEGIDFKQVDASRTVGSLSYVIAYRYVGESPMRYVRGSLIVVGEEK